MRIKIFRVATVAIISLSNASWADAAVDCPIFFSAEDYDRAASCPEAAEQCDAAAKYVLAHMHQFGVGVVEDYAESERWHKLAAAEGNICAQRNLGWRYFFGEGVVQDYVKAHMWYNVAAANGFDSAVMGRDKVAKLMTAEQIAEAQKRASACVDSGYKNC